LPIHTFEAVLILFVCYLIGAIPSAYIMGKLLRNFDIRKHGSGNVGFTNALRVLGVVPGIITLIMDIGKGFLSVAFAEYTYNNLYPFSLEIFLAIAGIITVCGIVFETRELPAECQQAFTDGAVTLLADDDLGQSLLRAVLVIDFITVNKHDDIGILLNGTRLTQV